VKKFGHYYSILIALFAGISMSTNFIFHKIEVCITQELFTQFGQVYPEESRTFLWAFESSTNFCFLNYIIIGVLTFTLILLLNIGFSKLEGKQIIANFANIFTYFGMFILFSYLFTPLILNRPVSVILAFGYSIVTGASSHLYLLRDRLRQKRRTPATSSTQSSHKFDFVIHSLELEHVEYRSLLHDIIWVCVTLSVGLFLGTALQYLFALPMEIALSNTFGSYMAVPLIQYIILIVGVFLGIIFQLMSEIHDIVDLIREKATTQN